MIRMENNIVMIPIGELEHHPENPRKDLGDLTELTDSIRKNGIYQNLTVVPDIDRAKYLVVIGNRRLEASKNAGLAALPCVISDMDHKEQIATMLEENMQRQDLTIYEQAEGFQMMMDLGFSEKEIGEKTGFSAKTVKDRLKLTKLNKKEFNSAVNNGASLIEMIEVTKLESRSAQNEVLKAAGTENFRQRLQMALRDQEFEKNKKRLLPVLKELGLQEIPSGERYSSKWEHEWTEDFRMEESEDNLRKNVEKKRNKFPNVPIVYEIHNYGSGGKIEFYHGKPKPGPMSAEEKTERQKSIIRGKHLRMVKSFWEQAYELRKDFVSNYTVMKGQSTATMGRIIVRRALEQCNGWQGKLQDNHKWNDAYIREVLGLPEEPEEKPNQDGVQSWKKKYVSIWEKVNGRADIPLVRVMVAWAVGGGLYWPDGPDHGLYDNQDGTYSKGSGAGNGVADLYDFLVEIGYKLSDMEQQLLDGTHECYQMEEL